MDVVSQTLGAFGRTPPEEPPITDDYQPNHLCQYLYELSQVYNQFYEHCPVLRSDEPVRTSRLALCEATARTLRVGLGLLGIEVHERI